MKKPSGTLCNHGSTLKALGAVAALACAAGGAGAASSTSSVSITSFSYVTSGATTLTWSDPYQSFQAQAMNAGGLLGTKLDGYDSTDYSFAIAGADTSQASASASTFTAQTFLASASTASSTGAATNQPNQAHSTATQSGAFALSGAGSVTFNVGYSMNVSSPGGNAASDYGVTTLSLDANNARGNSGGNTATQLMSFSQASGVGSRTGTLTLTVNLAANELGYYNLQGNAIAFSSAAVAAVPEPGEWALMLAGLAAVGAWTRRKAAAA